MSGPTTVKGDRVPPSVKTRPYPSLKVVDRYLSILSQLPVFGVIPYFEFLPQAPDLPRTTPKSTHQRVYHLPAVGFQAVGIQIQTADVLLDACVVTCGLDGPIAKESKGSLWIGLLLGRMNMKSPVLLTRVTMPLVLRTVLAFASKANTQDILPIELFVRVLASGDPMFDLHLGFSRVNATHTIRAEESLFGAQQVAHFLLATVSIPVRAVRFANFPQRGRLLSFVYAAHL